MFATVELIEPAITPLWQTFLATGSSTVLLLIAIRWLVAGQDKLIASLDKERTERINDLDERLRESEKHIVECNEDRKSIRERFIQHLENISKVPLILLACLLTCTSCQSWHARRSYSVFIEDAQGRKAGVGVLIEPIRSTTNK